MRSLSEFRAQVAASDVTFSELQRVMRQMFGDECPSAGTISAVRRPNGPKVGSDVLEKADAALDAILHGRTQEPAESVSASLPSSNAGGPRPVATVARPSTPEEGAA